MRLPTARRGNGWANMKPFYAQALCDYAGGLTACDNKACSRLPLLTAPLVEKIEFLLPDWLFVHRIAVELLPMRQCWRWQKPVEQVHFPGPEPTLPVRVHKRPEFRLRGSVPDQLHGLVQFDGNVPPGGWSFESMNRRALRRAQRADALLREPGYRFLAPTAGQANRQTRTARYQWGIAQGFSLNFQMVFGQRIKHRVAVALLL